MSCYVTFIAYISSFQATKSVTGNDHHACRRQLTAYLLAAKVCGTTATASIVIHRTLLGRQIVVFVYEVY